MMLKAGVVGALCLAWSAAAAQTPAPVIRQIAPDRFQPTPRGDYGQSAVAATVTPPTKDQPLGSCDKKARGWLNCLSATADLSTLLVSEAENTIAASLELRPKLSPSLQRVLANALADADAKWLELREQECGQLALLESAPGGQLYEAQLLCRIRHNMERVDQLKTHYGEGAPQPAKPMQSP